MARSVGAARIDIQGNGGWRKGFEVGGVDEGEGKGEGEGGQEGGTSTGIDTKKVAITVADKAKAELAKGGDRRAGLRIVDGGVEPAALKFAKDLMRNESARMDARLLVDYQTILEGHCK